MVGNLVALLLDRKTQDNDRTIARNAMVRIEEVGRIIRDIDQEGFWWMPTSSNRSLNRWR
jgi:hypothetical protein